LLFWFFCQVSEAHQPLSYPGKNRNARTRDAATLGRCIERTKALRRFEGRGAIGGSWCVTAYAAFE